MSETGTDHPDVEGAPDESEQPDPEPEQPNEKQVRIEP